MGARRAECKTSSDAGLIVRIVDESGMPVCDAVVMARDHDFSETLRPVEAGGGSTQCQYLGAYERTGTYTIDAERGGNSAEAAKVKVGADDCHVHPETVDLNCPGNARSAVLERWRQSSSRVSGWIDSRGRRATLWLGRGGHRHGTDASGCTRRRGG